MEPKKVEHPNIDEAERLLNDNWNERKQLVNQEFDLREQTQELILKGASKAAVDEARRAESECRDALAKNTEEYEALIDGWVASKPPVEDSTSHQPVRIPA